MFHPIRRTVVVAFISALAIAANLAIAGRVEAAPLPTSGLVLALDGTGVTTTSGIVSGWTDENTSSQLWGSNVGSPTLTTGVVFPNGTMHSVVSFNGTSGIALNANTPSLNLQTLAVYVVGDTTAKQTSGEFVTNYSNTGPSNGWAVGNSDTTAGNLKWFTGPGSDTLSNDTGLTVATGNYYLIDMTATSGVGPGAGKTSSIYNLTTNETASDSTNAIVYSGSEAPAVGFLDAFGGIQNLSGNVAEVLVYDTSNPSYNPSAIANYLEGKYFTPEPSSFVLLALGGFGGLFFVRRRLRDGRAIKRTVVVAFVSALAIASNMMASHAHAGALPPTGGLLMSLGANYGVTTTLGNVTGWLDETSNSQLVSSTVNTPTQTTITTPNGVHPAVNFNGSSGLGLNNGSALALQTLSVFVIGNITTNQNGTVFVTDIGFGGNGWATGITDSYPMNETKWYNGAGGSGLQDTTGLTMALTTAYQITTSTSGAGSTASLYDGTTTVSNSSGNTTITYGALGTSLGELAGFAEFLTGNIAEVLVYDNSNGSYNLASVNAYLDAKYFTPEPSSFALMGLAFGGLFFAARRRLRTGRLLASQG